MKNIFLSGILIYCFLPLVTAQNVYPYSYIGEYGLVDKEGEIVLEPIYDNINLFENYPKNKFTLFKNNGFQGILDSKGNVIIEAKYKKVIYNSNGSFAWVNNNEDNSLIIYSLNKDIQLTHSNSFRIHEVIGDETSFLQVINENSGQNIVYDESLKEILSFKSELNIILVEKYKSNECPLIQLEDQIGKIIKSIDCTGKEINELEYSNKYNFPESEDIWFFDFDETSGEDLEKIIDGIKIKYPEYIIVESVKKYNGEVESVIVKKDNKYGLLSTKGEVLLPLKYYSLSSANNFIIARNFLFQYGLFTNVGKEVYPIKFKFLNYNLHLINLVYLETNECTFYGNLQGGIYKPKDLELKLD